MVADYGNRLFAAATIMCPNDHDAEELVFRTFEQAVRKIRQFRPTGSFYAWLYTIMLNFRRMDVRRKCADVIPYGTTADLPEIATDSFAALMAGAEVDAVREAVRGLSEPLKVVVVLKYFENWTLDEIGVILAIPVGTVKSRLHNARSALTVALSRKSHVKENEK